jgi:hypothetical protein
VGAVLTPSVTAMMHAAPNNVSDAPTGSSPPVKAAMNMALIPIDSAHSASQSIVSLSWLARDLRQLISPGDFHSRQCSYRAVCLANGST